MSTATAAVELAEDHGRPTFGSLFAAEWLRLRSRRLVKIVLATGFVLLTLIVVIIGINSGNPSPQDLAAAQQRADQSKAACIEATSQDPQVPKGTDLSSYCATDASGYGIKQPYDFISGYRDGAIGIGLGVAALFFLIGASAGGAEWSARTMPALLYWEPRRLRVMFVKTIVLALFAIAVSFVGQLIWLVYANGLKMLRGADPAPPLPSGYWTEVAGIASRGFLLAVLVAVGAFALANLTRNTAAALGIGFVYFAVVENVVSALLPRFSRWTLVNNVGALLTPGGVQVSSGDPSSFASTQTASASSDMSDVVSNGLVTISNLRGGIVLTLVVVVFLAIATILFKRRDIS